MHSQSFEILEYDRLKALVERSAQTSMGAARVATLQPISSLAELQAALEAVAECVNLRNRGATLIFREIRDPQEELALLRVDNSVLEPAAMLSLKSLIDQAMSARAAILAEREVSPRLWTIVSNLPVELSRLSARVANKILPSGELDDRASPELARIRHDITVLRSRITRTLENVMRKSAEAIQDELVTIRNERFVIPVKADHRGRVNGVAHGYSSSGATAFIEPLETIEANNELQSLHEEETREIYRILFGLTDEIRAQLPAIQLATEVVANLDFIHAKATFYQKFDCVIPMISTQEQIYSLKNARHPLLEETLRFAGGSVVPVSFSLDEENNTMIVSGANAGGKTVVLKTAGLVALMALSGMPVPAAAANIPFYASVLSDIGDHQSISANLSTFTSHIANISRMIELCQAPALVLLDEVGTGTDPEEGSALGVAVVDHFRKSCRAQVIATTHYSGLKMYAARESGVINASVEFDEKTLQPTYRLIVGVAGSSSGLEIAKRFGIPAEVIDEAVGSVSESSRQASAYLRRIKQESEDAASLRIALEEERTAVAEKFASLDKEAARHERERQASFQRAMERTIAEFEKRSRELVAAIQDRSDRLKLERESQKRVAELKRETQRTLSAGQKEERPVRVVRDGRIVSHEIVEDTTKDVYLPAESAEINVGDRVKLRTFGSIGIVDSIKGDEAEVRVKSLRLREKLANLDRVELNASAKPAEKLSALRKAAVNAEQLPAGNGQSEINVIGQTTDTAVDAVDKFLDEASLASLSQVRIIHGHGTGALRRAIAELLKDHPHVARFASAPQDQGGSGATLVELRQ